jgi:hypothetical protein
MENNIKITFWLNRVKKNSKNLVPVYMRVTQNYDFFNKATGIRISAGDWDKKAMRIRGATQEVATTNATLDSLRVKVLQVVNQLNLSGKLQKPDNLTTFRRSKLTTSELVL